MKGVIFNLVEEIVVANHGDETWERLLDRAEVRGAYTSLGSYDDSELMGLVAAAANELALPATEVLRWIGQQAMPIMVGRWPGFFAAHTATAPFLRSLNSIIHPEVHKLYRGARCPHFDFAESADGALLIGYRSKRSLCRLAHGFIEGAAAHYGETADLHHLRCMRHGDESCLISARLTAIPSG